MDTLKIATLNISDLSSPTRIAMLDAFVQLHDLDIILLQEITQPVITDMTGYIPYYNMGTTRRGTAIITRDLLTLTRINPLPSGRAIASDFGDLTIINIYAPSGALKRCEREAFFNNELAYLLQNVSDNFLMGGDFNSILGKSDSTGHYNFSRSLAALTQGYAVTDSRKETSSRRTCTHYTAHGASRLDRIYLSRDLMARKLGIETTAANFTDQLHVVLRLILDAPILRRGRCTWKLNCTLLTENHITEDFWQKWAQWKRQHHLYPDINMWWSIYCKNESECCSDTRKLNASGTIALWNFLLWMRLWHITRHGFSRCESPRSQSHKSKNCQTTHITARHHGRWPPGRETIHTVPTNTDAKNQTARTVRSVLDDNGIIQTPPKEIALAFTIFLRSKYGAISIDAACVRTMADIVRVDNHKDNADCLENPFDPCELYKAIHSGGRNKTIGRDGLGLEFYKSIWTTIKDDLCLILNLCSLEDPSPPSKSSGQSYAYPKCINLLRLPTIAK